MGNILTGDSFDDLKDELNSILKRINDRLDTIQGRRGDYKPESRQIMQDDLIFDDTTRGVILKDDGTPPRFWRLWVDSSGTIYTESIGGSY